MITKVVHISDTHTKHYKLKIPECDILIHSGDLTSRGYPKEIESFLKWFSTRNAKYKIFIPGNHDICFDYAYDHETNANSWLPDMMTKYGVNKPNSGIYCLINNGMDAGKLHIWGSPITPWFRGHRWAFNKHRGEEIAKVWSQIPYPTDILITHGPPAYILDYVANEGAYVGCEDLRNKLDVIHPKLHLFGHIHEGYGAVKKDVKGREVVFSNASIVNFDYDAVNEPLIYEL